MSLFRRRRDRGPRVILGLLAAVAAVSAAQGSEPRIYRYDVEHPTYGRIGSYTNIIQGTDRDAQVRSELHVAVKILGVTVYREDATRIEQWRGSRMAFFDGLTVTNNNAIHVSGEARDGHFAITSPAGTILAPADVKPSNPWSMAMLHDGAIMSTKTGRVFDAHVLTDQPVAASADGFGPDVRRYDVVSNKREVVWFNTHGVAVAFDTVADGARIRFVLRPN